MLCFSKATKLHFCFKRRFIFQDKTKPFQQLENQTMLKDICMFHLQVSNEVASVRNHSLNYSSDTNCELTRTSYIKAILFL